jgi:radical SAM protein with 4Fe4S-binding SPASM domain
VRELQRAGLHVKLLGAWIDVDEETDLPLACRLSQGLAQNLGRSAGGREASIPLEILGGPANALLKERGQPLTELGEVYLHLTDECDGSCRHCYNASAPAADEPGAFVSGRGEARELSFAEWRSVADEAVSLGARSFVVLGGDPFAKDCLLPLLDHLTGELACTVRLFLGPLPRLDPEGTANGLAEAGHGRLIPMVSLEGPEEANDRIRGTGSFAASRRLIELLRGAGLEPFVNTVLLRPCLSTLPDLPETLVELGIRRLHLILPHQRGRAGGEHQLIPTGREMLLAFGALQSSASTHGVAIDNLNAWRARLAKPRDLCNAGCSLLALDPYGGVYPCPITVGDVVFEAGNVRADTLASLWRASPVFELVRSAHALDRKSCRECDVVQACGGECWVQAHYAARAAGGRGGFGVPFPYCDFVRPLLREISEGLGQTGGGEDGAPPDLTPFECT